MIQPGRRPSADLGNARLGNKLGKAKPVLHRGLTEIHRKPENDSEALVGAAAGVSVRLSVEWVFAMQAVLSYATPKRALELGIGGAKFKLQSPKPVDIGPKKGGGRPPKE